MGNGINNDSSGAPAQPLRLSERHKVLVEWNQTRQAYPRDTCFHQLFETQAEISPSAIAIESQGKRLTYEQLNVRANRLARHLQDLGVGPEVLVGVYLHPSLDLLVALLAILKAGGAFVPLDPTYPKDRLDYMIADSQMKVIITQEDLVSAVSSKDVQIVRADEIPTDSESSRDNPSSGVQADNLAYVIYTSGSTGRPKGVMVPHRGLVNYLCWAVQAYRVAEGSGAPVHSSISFDLTMTGLFTPLLVGRCVYVLPIEHGLDALSKILRRGCDFSLVKITPAHLQVLCSQLSESEAAAATRSFIIGGEALFGQNIEFCRRCARPTILVNEYGPTEAVVGCCVYFVGDREQFDGPIPIGRPIANTQLYVLDANLEPVAVGQIGELHIAGDGLARGYLNLPELTAQKFIVNPFAQDGRLHPRMYKTGDLARYLPNGDLQFVGRLDDQIKIRSYRIELGEIEAALLDHPALKDAAVVARTDASHEKYLAAYYIKSGNIVPSEVEVRRHLKLRLPEYMIPAIFVEMAEFPLTANGKVDRTALPTPARESHAFEEDSGVHMQTETRLAELWGKALARRVGFHDNFFDLGGHSLIAVRLATEINECFKTDVDALMLYQHPTVHELAGFLDRSSHESHRPKIIPVRAGHGASVFFLNAPLEFVKLATLMEVDESFYISNVPFPREVLDAAIRFDAKAFPTLEELVTPHAMLIRNSRPIGACFLAGFSSYGTVAFETAHQLKKAGVAVEGVFLFDAEMKAPRWEIIKVRLARHARATKEKGAHYLWQKARARFKRDQDKAQTSTLAEGEMLFNAPVSNGEIPWPMYQRIWDHALRDYKPNRLNSRGVLFRAAGTVYSDEEDYDGLLGWRNLFVGGLDVVSVPGDHISMWQEPHIHTLRQLWENSLQKMGNSAKAVFRSAPAVLAAITCVF